MPLPLQRSLNGITGTANEISNINENSVRPLSAIPNNLRLKAKTSLD